MVRISKDQEKKEFLSMLSHELRNPLSAILSSVELLRLQDVHPPGTAMLLETIEERVRVMTGMLDNMLTTPRFLRTAGVSKPISAPARLGHTKDARTILVVDDNEMAAEALGRLLELCGHTVATAHNGAEAVEKASRSRPQIIILDIGLPDMDGYEVVRMLQKVKNYAPTFVALTGYGQNHDKARALKAGFHMHLTKPLGFKEIEAAFLQVRPAPQVL